MNNYGHEKEGVIKFNLVFEQCDVVLPEMIQEISPWREKLFALKLIGQDPLLYDGLSYGNISHRILLGSGQFVITGSQTSHLPVLLPNHYALVTQSFIDENKLVAKGQVKPSSEALTHCAFYHARPNINYVFHVHSPTIWNSAKSLDIPITSPTVAYGTPEMAEEISRLFKSGVFDTLNIVAMGGHRDGVIAFGMTADQTGQAIIDALELASH